MLNEIFSDLWKNYRGRLLGSIFGLFIGVIFLILGFLQTIFLLICITAGFFLGNKLDKKRRPDGMAGQTAATRLS